MVRKGRKRGVRAMQVVRTDDGEVYPMKTLKRWVRDLLDWIAVSLGYTPVEYVKEIEGEADAWREAYTSAQRRYSIAQDRLNRLMRYKHVQKAAANLDSGRARK